LNSTNQLTRGVATLKEPKELTPRRHRDHRHHRCEQKRDSVTISNARSAAPPYELVDPKDTSIGNEHNTRHRCKDRIPSDQQPRETSWRTHCEAAAIQLTPARKVDAYACAERHEHNHDHHRDPPCSRARREGRGQRELEYRDRAGNWRNPTWREQFVGANYGNEVSAARKLGQPSEQEDGRENEAKPDRDECQVPPEDAATLPTINLCLGIVKRQGRIRRVAFVIGQALPESDPRKVPGGACRPVISMLCGCEMTA
jgi:hypothetical protein